MMSSTWSCSFLLSESLDLDSGGVAGGEGLRHAAHLHPTGSPESFLPIPGHIVALCRAVLGRQELLLAGLDV